jgi:CSLREA domain-containing protein
VTSIKLFVRACSILVLLAAISVDAASLTVNSISDDGTGTCTVGKCTLRDAIASAGSGDIITFSLPANSTIALSRGELLIRTNVTISGPGPDALTVQRSTAPGTAAFRIFRANSAVDPVVISGLRIANGVSTDDGGGIYNDNGALTVDNCIISGNSASDRGGGIHSRGVFNEQPVTISNSTISGNSAVDKGGGIAITFGPVTITNSTISGNSAGVAGGGVENLHGTVTIANSTISGSNLAPIGGGIYNRRLASVGTSTVTIANSTISGNVATAGGGIYNSDGTVILTGATIVGNSAIIGGSTGGGGGIYQRIGTISSRNTIIALNSAVVGPDIDGPLVSQGFNLIGNTSAGTITGDTTGNQLNVNPMIGPLQDNGGPTFTHALRDGSPAIDRGHSSGRLHRSTWIRASG